MATATTALDFAAPAPMAAGRHVLGVGLMAMGALSLAWGDFVTGQSAIGALGSHVLQAYAAGAVMFGTGAIVFGGAHFAYMNLTVPLVPKWLPPSQDFWAAATGACHVAAGIALVTGFRARLAAILLTVMYASFQPLVHIPMLIAPILTGKPAGHFIWGENAINLALTGAAWGMADALVRTERELQRSGRT